MFLRAMILTGALLAAPMLPGNAEAAPARTTADLNMRAGPGVKYKRIAVIPSDGRVQILSCTPGKRWCQVTWGNRKGWASGRYLAATRLRGFLFDDDRRFENRRRDKPDKWSVDRQLQRSRDRYWRSRGTCPGAHDRGGVDRPFGGRSNGYDCG